MVEYCEKLAELVIWLDVSESTSQDFNGRKLLPWSPKVENAEIIICWTISRVRTYRSPTSKYDEPTVA